MYENVFANETLNIFTDLLSVPSPTGREELIAKKIRGYIDIWGYQSEQDYAGNVLVRVKGGGKSDCVTMTASHMDEIGLVVTGIEKDGGLCVSNLGGSLPWKIGERPVEILTDKRDSIIGVVSFGAGHSQMERKEINWGQVRVITGLRPEQLKEKGIRVGSAAVPAREFRGPTVFGEEDDPIIGACNYDDRMGCALQLSVLKAMKEDGLIPNCDWIFAFPKQEEVKGNGIKPLAIREQPDVLITIDGSPIFQDSGITLGGGPVVITKDKLADYSFEVILAIQKAAKSIGQDLQYCVTDKAYTDASLALQCGGPLRIGSICFPSDNAHGYELMKFSDLKQYIDLFYHFIKTFIP